MQNIKNVFIIDDSKTIIKSTKKLLSEFDFKVHSFTNPKEALEKAQEIAPELILLDYFMPEMNGATFMIKVSEKLLNNDWQVFLISSHDFTQEEQLSMLTLGITHIFSKPLQREQFIEAIS